MASTSNSPSPLDIPKNSRTTAPLLKSIPSVTKIRNSNTIRNIEPSAFLSRSFKVDEEIRNAGRGILPGGPMAKPIAQGAQIDDVE